MIGLPTETDDDLVAIRDLTLQMRERIIESRSIKGPSRAHRRQRGPTDPQAWHGLPMAGDGGSRDYRPESPLRPQPPREDGACGRGRPAGSGVLELQWPVVVLPIPPNGLEQDQRIARTVPQFVLRQVRRDGVDPRRELPATGRTGVCADTHAQTLPGPGLRRAPGHPLYDRRSSSRRFWYLLTSSSNARDSPSRKALTTPLSSSPRRRSLVAEPGVTTAGRKAVSAMVPSQCWRSPAQPPATTSPFVFLEHVLRHSLCRRFVTPSINTPSVDAHNNFPAISIQQCQSGATSRPRMGTPGLIENRTCGNRTVRVECPLLPTDESVSHEKGDDRFPVHYFSRARSYAMRL